MSRHRRLTAVAVAVSIASLTVLATPVPAFADEVRDGQWYLGELEIDKAHKLSLGAGITIGLVDSGVNADHKDLRGNVKPGKDYGTEDKGLRDERGHGTWTSSLMVGHGHGESGSSGVKGVAPEAQVISVGVSTEDEIEDNDIASAIEWLVDKKVDLISVSMYGNGDYDAVDYAVDNEIPVVGSAGNCVVEDPFLGRYENTFMSWPASAPGAIPVTGSIQGGKFWDCSVDLQSAPRQPQLGLSAPAENIMGAAEDGGYGAHDGTSAAAPIVAGTLALIKSAYPDLGYKQVNERLLLTVDDKGPEGFDDKFGWGIVNPYRALTEDVKHVEGGTSTKADLVPLEEQGKGGSGENDSVVGDGETLTASTGSLLIPMLVMVAAVLAATTVIGVVVAGRRKQAKSFANQNIRS